VSLEIMQFSFRVGKQIWNSLKSNSGNFWKLFDSQLLAEQILKPANRLPRRTISLKMNNEGQNYFEK
jgi:Fe-S cluster biosynthesis and repair protein YggX